MNDDHQQLEAYATHRSEEAFGTFVQRHARLVYAVALRRVGGDAHRAQDVTQLVFTTVAMQALRLSRHPDLVGWLFTTTRRLAAKTVRTETRRAAREAAAGSDPSLMSEQPSPPPASELEPLLDDCLADLPAADRHVILLRFYRGLRLGEIGALTGASDNAVQKRVERALERLRARLAGRGVTSTAAAVALTLEQQSAVALPGGLVTVVTAASLAQGAAASGAVATGVIAVTKFQLVAAIAVMTGVSVGTGWQLRENNRLRRELATEEVTSNARIAGLNSNLAALSRRKRAANDDGATMQAALDAAAKPQPTTSPSRVLTDPDADAQTAMNHAAALARSGKRDDAVAEYVKVYRSLKGSGRATINRQIIMGALVRLGQIHPQAIAAVRELRDEALARYRANPGVHTVVSEIALLNERLGDDAANIALYESLPVGDPGRQAVGMIGQRAFVERRRYADALVGKSFPAMVRELDLTAQASGRAPGDAGHRELAIQQTATNIEVLAGAGRADEARTLTDKLLAFDNSASTRALVQQHVARATQSSAP